VFRILRTFPPPLWMIFFWDGPRLGWWDVFTRPGFRHVGAAAWFPSQERWVFYDVSREGTEISVLREEESEEKFCAWVGAASHILRMPGPAGKVSVPSCFYCVGAMKSLLGIKGRALVPQQLHAHLLRIGAEVVEMPGASSEAPAGRSRDCEDARHRDGAR
jgi:hypothetical protein